MNFEKSNFESGKKNLQNQIENLNSLLEDTREDCRKSVLEVRLLEIFNIKLTSCFSWLMLKNG